MVRRAKNGTTITDIAKKLRLSAMTVSRALNSNPEVSDKTRERVLRAAQTMGYQPNRWARSLVTRRSMMIGVVIPDIAHAFFAEITCGVEDVIEKSGYDIFLCHSRGDAARERSEIQMLVGSQVDGLIVASVQPLQMPEIFTDLRQRKVPFVLVDRFFPESELPSVRVDDLAVGRIATEFLIGLGHRRIAHLEGPSLSPGALRWRGYLEALRAAQIEADPQWVMQGDFQIEGGREAMGRLLQVNPRPTAVFVANDPMAIGAVYACRNAGLRVPEDVSVVGAGNIEGPHHPNPFLTTVDWPREELGREAARMLLVSIQDPAARVGSKVFTPNLLVRQSTAKPCSREVA